MTQNTLTQITNPASPKKKSEKFFWNTYAVCYDTITRLIPYQEMMTEIVSHLNLKPGERLLDAGCGTANLERTLWENFRTKYPGHPLRIDAVDFSESMLLRAIRKCETLHEISFRWMNLNEPLPYPDGIFDKIACVNTLYALQNPENILNEFFRLLKKNGKIVLVVPRSDFNTSEVARSHLRGLRNGSAFGQFLSLTKDAARLPAFVWVMACNMAIEKKEKDGHYNTFSKDSAETLLQKQFAIHESKYVYANQFCFVSAVKGER